jgi:hypothetical protein
MVSRDTNTLLHPDSMGDTLDAINAAYFYGNIPSQKEREEIASWVAYRQGMPGSYAGMFAPTQYDIAFGTLTFTGEPVLSRAGTAHLLSEEACRALYLLSVDDREVAFALNQARSKLFKRLAESELEGEWSGVYCCGMCSVALWRHLLASGQQDDTRRIENGLKELHRYRDGKGRWKRFPFFYTLLALGEMTKPAVQDEIRYAAPVIQRSLNKLVKQSAEQQTEYDRRRQNVLERALALC